jgi:gas vesicle protein
MSRLLAVLAAVAIGATATLAIAPRDGAKAANPAPTVLKVGDRVQVEGQPVGCRVANQGSKVVMDCRRAGTLAGTYGTMLSSRAAQVVRFRSNNVAKVVYTATHHGSARRCR